jgi:hypothetical protein
VLLLGLAVVVPVMVALYSRRRAPFDFIARLPRRIEIPVGTTTFAVETEGIVAAFTGFVRALAVDAASIAAVLSLDPFPFVILLYALVLRPEAAGQGVYAVVFVRYYDVERLNGRVRDTLYGIYPPGRDRRRDARRRLRGVRRAGLLRFAYARGARGDPAVPPGRGAERRDRHDGGDRPGRGETPSARCWCW